MNAAHFGAPRYPHKNVAPSKKARFIPIDVLRLHNYSSELHENVAVAHSMRLASVPSIDGSALLPTSRLSRTELVRTCHMQMDAEGNSEWGMVRMDDSHAENVMVWTPSRCLACVSTSESRKITCITEVGRGRSWSIWAARKIETSAGM